MVVQKNSQKLINIEKQLISKIPLGKQVMQSYQLQLSFEKLKEFLKKFVIFPNYYRQQVYQFFLELPFNRSEFEKYVSQGIIQKFEKYSTSKYGSCKVKVMSALSNFCPIFSEISYLENYMLNFFYLAEDRFQNTDLLIFQSIYCFIIHWCQHFFKQYPNQPGDYLQFIYDILIQEDKQFIQNLRNTNPHFNYYSYLFPVIQNLTKYLNQNDFQMLIDRLFAYKQHPQLLAYVFVRLIIRNKESLLAITNQKQLDMFFNQKLSIDMKNIIKQAMSLLKKLKHKELNLKFQNRLPLTSRRYPIFTNYPIQKIAFAKRITDKIGQQKRELQKNKLQNDKMNQQFNKILENKRREQQKMLNKVKKAYKKMQSEKKKQHDNMVIQYKQKENERQNRMDQINKISQFLKDSLKRQQQLNDNQFKLQKEKVLDNIKRYQLQIKDKLDQEELYQLEIIAQQNMVQTMYHNNLQQKQTLLRKQLQQSKQNKYKQQRIIQLRDKKQRQVQRKKYRQLQFQLNKKAEQFNKQKLKTTIENQTIKQGIQKEIQQRRYKGGKALQDLQQNMELQRFKQVDKHVDQINKIKKNQLRQLEAKRKQQLKAVESQQIQLPKLPPPNLTLPPVPVLPQIPDLGQDPQLMYFRHNSYKIANLGHQFDIARGIQLDNEQLLKNLDELQLKEMRKYRIEKEMQRKQLWKKQMNKLKNGVQKSLQDLRRQNYQLHNLDKIGWNIAHALRNKQYSQQYSPYDVQELSESDTEFSPIRL